MPKAPMHGRQYLIIEVRTPLSTINLQADLLRSSNSQDNTNVIVQRIKSTSNQLVRVLDEWILSGKEINFSVSGDLKTPNNAFQRAIDLVMNSFPNAKLQIHKPCFADVRFDERVLLLSLNSLITNSLIHGASTKGTRINLYNDKEHLHIAIRDWGTGMDTRQLSEIFDRQSLTHVEHGSGLGVGLHLLHKLVVSSGGNIKVYSRQSVGSLFVLSVPLSTRN